MRNAGVIAVAVLVLATAAQGDEIDKAKLQATLRVPRIPIMLGANTSAGLTGTDSKPDPRKQIDITRRTFKGEPSDAGRYYDLGGLYREAGEVESSRQAFTQAVALYQQQLRSNPDRTELLLPLGRALLAADQDDEAEKVLRLAAQKTPGNWEVWTQLGKLLLSRVMAELFGGPEQCPGKIEADTVYQLALQGRFTRDAAEKADQLLAEAVHCYERAVEVAPNQPEPYYIRSGFWMWRKAFRLSIDVVRGKRDEPGKLWALPESLADTRRAVALGITDPRAIVGTVTMELLAAAPESHGRAPTGTAHPWNSLAEESRVHVRRGLELLEKLGRDRDPTRAGDALATLAVLQCGLLRDIPAAEKSARQAVTFDPNNAVAWEVLIGTLIEQERDEDCLQACQDRVKHHDSTQSRLLLGRSYVQLKQDGRAEEEYRAAVQMDPDHFLANLSLATVILKRRTDETSRTEAVALIRRAKSRLNEAPLPEHRLDFFAVGAVACALGNDSENAQKILELVLAEDADHPVAREALQILKK